MRIRILAALVFVGCTPKAPASRPMPITTAAHTSPLPVMVPEDARSVVFTLTPGDLTAIGEDFENATELRAIACVNLPSETQLVSLRAAPHMEMRFSSSWCVDAARVPQSGGQ